MLLWLNVEVADIAIDSYVHLVVTEVSFGLQGDVGVVGSIVGGVVRLIEVEVLRFRSTS